MMDEMQIKCGWNEDEIRMQNEMQMEFGRNVDENVYEMLKCRMSIVFSLNIEGTPKMVRFCQICAA